MGKGEIAHYEQFLRFQRCFQKDFYCRHMKNQSLFGKGFRRLFSRRDLLIVWIYLFLILEIWHKDDGIDETCPRVSAGILSWQSTEPSFITSEFGTLFNIWGNTFCQLFCSISSLNSWDYREKIINDLIGIVDTRENYMSFSVWCLAGLFRRKPEVLL